MKLSVLEAAKRMNVSPRRVRQLIAEERLDAQKVGSQWVVDAAALAQISRNRSAGRPLSPRNSLALAQTLEGEQPAPMSPVDRHRLSRCVHDVSALDNPLNKLQSLLSSRAELVRLSASQADVARLREDPRIALSGVSDPRSGLMPGHEVEAYVSSSHTSSVIKDWYLVPAVDGETANVLLRITENMPGKVPALYSAMDLAERSGFREQSAAASIIRSTLAH